MGLRDIGAAQYVFGALENVQAANGFNLTTGVWMLDGEKLSLGIDGGLFTLWTEASEADSLHNLINYVEGKLGGLVIFRPFSTAAGGIFAKYDYIHPVKENALSPVHSISLGFVFDLL